MCVTVLSRWIGKMVDTLIETTRLPIATRTVMLDGVDFNVMYMLKPMLSVFDGKMEAKLWGARGFSATKHVFRFHGIKWSGDEEDEREQVWFDNDDYLACTRGRWRYSWERDDTQWQCDHRKTTTFEDVRLALQTTTVASPFNALPTALLNPVSIDFLHLLLRAVQIRWCTHHREDHESFWN